MPLREVFFHEKDVPLREDVRLLGALVGEMLREQGGEVLFRSVERARQAAIRRREGDPEGEIDLQRVLAARDVREAAALVRAFSVYFQAINLAEDVHRIRRRRDYLRESEHSQPESLEDVFSRLETSGRALGEVMALLERASIELVFTAHPSEATRRTMLEKQQRIARRLVDRFDPSRTPREERTALERIRAEITSMWQTEEHASERPSVADEAEHVLFYLTNVLYRIVPPFYEILQEALIYAYGDRAGEVPIASLLRFGSWVGGDMDGNPNVNARTIAETLARQRDLILDRYGLELRDLYGQLSQSSPLIGIDRRLRARSEEYAGWFPDAAQRAPQRHRSMPYRVFLRLIGARLEATRNGQREGYRDAAELSGDLGLIAESLAANKGMHAGLFSVKRLLRRVETFGFHLATLDVRQNAMVHRQIVGRGLGEDRWCSLPAEERLARLRRALEERKTPVADLGEDGRGVVAVFETIARCRERFGDRAVGPYVVSMTESLDDLLSVLLLARWGGLVDGRGSLDVAPLFETLEDLERAPAVMQAAMEDRRYREHLDCRGNQQMVMVGYSDSNKDAGLAASRWAVEQAQSAVLGVLARSAIQLTIFHGRGGSVGRGGGKTHRAILAAPPRTVDGRFRVTEQGEIIRAKYGLRGIAARNLEQTASAVVLASLGGAGSGQDHAGWRRVMDTVAAESLRAYRDLIRAEPRLLPYFRQATPIDVIERMPIGSRPAARGTGPAGVADLRAIPWVFAWTQSRHLLPGWYGVGAGLAAAVREHGRDAVVEAARGWTFLGGMLDDVEMVLAKADLAIAARYAELADGEVAPLFGVIRDAYEQTVEEVLAVKGSTALLEEDPTLQRSIRLRNPYVDPMSLLQVDLLRRWRAGGRRDEELFRALLATVNGIAAGLQNTG